MSVGIKSWSTTAGSNGSADSNVNFAENQLAPTLNDGARALMAVMAAWRDTLGGANAMGGSSNAYTITNNAVNAWSAYAAGDLVMLKANHTNNGAATVNVDSLGAKAIKKGVSTAVASGEIASGGLYLLCYDGTNFQIIGDFGSYQANDATLTALAALTIAAGKVIVGTGTDTFTLYDVEGADTNILTGTAGTSGDLAVWNADGDLVDGPTPPSGAIVGTTDSQSLSNKTINGGSIQSRVQTSSETSGALTSSSANKTVQCSGNITLPSSDMDDGDIILIDPRGSARTITRPGAHTMYIFGSDSATGTTGAHNIVTAMYHGSSKWTLQGSVS